MNCPHCGSTVQAPEDRLQWAGNCTCGRSVFDAVQDDEQPVDPGDIYEDGRGLSIVTPWGDWQLTDEQVMTLMQGLASMLKFRLTRPWAADDSSTILSRGRAAEERARLEEA